MADLTLRNVKGSPLTNQEVDDNFSNLNTSKYESGDSPIFVSTTTDTLKITGGTGTQGTISWNVEDETLDLIVSDDVTYQLGQELGFVARNLSGQTLANGTVVRATGASGDKLTINIADATTELGSAPTVGVVTETINNNSTGRVTTAGFVRGLDTSTIAEGSAIYLGTNGTFTATQPTSPSHLVHIGWVIRSHATEGSILVHVNNGWELEELHNVLITSVADNEVLQWNAASGVWENVAGTTSNIAEGTNLYYTDARVSTYLTTNNYATESYVSTAVSNLVDSAPATLDTLNELAAALGDDPNFATTVSTSIGTKWTQDNTKISNWDTAYSWGDHAAAGYVTSVSVDGGSAASVYLSAQSIDGGSA